MKKIISLQKVIALLILTVTLFACQKHDDDVQPHDENFTSENVSQTASIILDSTIQVVFPLFGAFEERKWAKNWNPILVYPNEEIIEEGTTFKTHGHGTEAEYLWIVNKYDPQSYFIEYLVSTDNRFWTISITCGSIENDTKTQTTVSYSFTGLTTEGNEFNDRDIENIFEQNLQDWADAINNYLRG